MPLFMPTDSYYNGTAMNLNTRGWSGTASTNSSGDAIFYLTDTGLAGGVALFTDILAQTIRPVSWVPDRVITFASYTVSADKKSVTIACKENTSLLGLGLIPFAAAASGRSIALTCIGY